MSSELFRNYIDFINEAEDQRQLDEGIGDWLKTKVSGLVDKFVSSSPSAKQAYQQALSRKDELLNILKTSKSADEVKKKTEALAKSDASTKLAEGFMDHPGQTLGGALGVLGGTAYMVLNKIYDTMGHVMSIPTADPTQAASMFADERLPYMVVNYGFPLLCIIYGLTLLFYVGTSKDKY